MKYQEVKTSDRLPVVPLAYWVREHRGFLDSAMWNKYDTNVGKKDQEDFWKANYESWLEPITDDGSKEQEAMAKTELILTKNLIEYSGDGETGV